MTKTQTVTRQEYVAITASGFDIEQVRERFNEDVGLFLGYNSVDGWRAHGGMTISVTVPATETPYIVLGQAFVREVTREIEVPPDQLDFAVEDLP